MPTLVFYIPFLLIWALVAIYLERKVAAFIQDRLGPMEVGYKGILQTTADLLKLLGKEIIIPAAAHKALFVIAPVWSLTTVLVSFCFLPVHPTWSGVPTQVGVLGVLALLALKPMGILVAGWASNNKFARLGALRAALQFLSYEIPLGLSVLCVVLICPSLDLAQVIAQQGLPVYDPAAIAMRPSYLLGIKGLEVTQLGGLLTWNLVRMPCLIVAYALFFVTSLCISNRIPFDLAESESELVAGYHVEYTGLYWAWLIVTEYAVLFLMALLGVILFLGGWNTPLPNLGPFKLALYTNGIPGTCVGTLWAFFWLFGKTIGVVWVQMWIRWTFPRFRADQLFYLCWWYFIPVGLLVLLVTIWWQFLIL